MKNMQTPTDYTGSERGLENKLPTTATPNQHYVTLDVKERERMEGWMTSNASNWSLSNSSLEADANPQNLYAISLLLSCLYTIFLFPLGLVGNVLILVVNFDPCQRMSSPDLYFTNLALADLVLVLDSLIEVFNLSARYYDDAVLCTCMALFLQVNMYSSVFSLTWMSLDRCLALTALSARSLPAQPSALSQKPRLARTACVAIWAAAVLCTLLPFASAHARHGWGRGFCFAGVAEVQWLEVTLGFAVPFCVMGACYATIARVLLLRSGAVACGRCGDDHRRRRRQRAKALRMIVAAVSVFFVCWLPENVFIGVHLLGGETEPSRRRGNSTLWQRYPLTGHVVTLAACANSCLNPLIYSLLGRTFRRKLRLFVKRHALCLARREDGEGPRPYAPTCLRGAHTHHGKASQEDSREPREGSDAERKEACDCERDRESDSCQSV